MKINIEWRNLWAAHRSLRMGLAIKVSLLVALLILLGASVTAVVLYNLSLNALKEEIGNKLISIASTATTALDPEKIKQLRSPSDETTPVYRELQAKLQTIQKNCHDKLRYLYVIVKSGEKYIYVLDATPVGEKDHSTIGDVFDMSEFPAALFGFKYPTADPKPLFDKEFGVISQSGYAPIRDDSGNTVAMLGIDMDITIIREEEAKIMMAAGKTVMISLLLALTLGIAFSRYLVKPIQALIHGTERVAAGNFETRIEVKRRDEFGMLAASFNAMNTDLKATHDELLQINQGLEAKIRERTAEISEVNREIRDILDNMEEGILTFNKDLVINPQYSRFTVDIFGAVQLGGIRIDQVLFPSGEDGETQVKLVEWLRLIFEMPVLVWGNLEQIQPVREMAVRMRDELGHIRERHVKLIFRPIMKPSAGEHGVAKIMLIVQDVSDKKKLEREMATQAKEYQENLHDIVEVIQLDQELFMMFINNCREQLLDFEPKLIRLQKERENEDLLNELFRIAHTIKGNANQFKLERIAREIHGLEEIFDKLRRRERVISDELLNDLFHRLDLIRTRFKSIEEVYLRVTRGKNRDIGKTCSSQRQPEEASMIRVKMEDLDYLIGLVQKGCAHENGGEDLAECRNILTESFERLQAMKRIPLGRMFTRFPRMVRDIAVGQGKEVDLIIQGEDIVVDKYVFERLGDPLVHIIRNGVDHGVETSAERIGRNKPKEGRIEVYAEMTAGQLIIAVRDDGRGIDLERVVEKAVDTGLISGEDVAGWDEKAKIDLIFAPGFSTNERLTEISGRGVGMDVVKNVIVNELHGNIELTTEKGRGTEIRLTIPI